MSPIRLSVLFGLLRASAAASPIKHVVVLMLENRAFDHLFGWAGDLLGVDGVSGRERLPTSTESEDPTWVNVSKDAPYINVCDPCHTLPCTTSKIFGKKQVKSGKLENSSMMGFVEQESSHPSYCNVVDMFTPDKLPVLTALAREFAIMDRFFCSVPGPTWPNRMFQLAATSSGQTETGIWYHNKVGQLFPTRTIFDQIEEANMTWRNYYNDTPWELFLEKIAFSHDEVRPLKEFYRDAADGNLPSFAWLNPSSGMDLSTGFGSNDHHPDHDVRLGEWLVKDIYEALRASPQWNETLFVLTYDEHGGFFDHVSPPAAPAPGDGEASYPDKFEFNRLGVRVPVLLASPWIAKGTVVSAPPPHMKPKPDSEYDATSILATARRLLGMPTEPLTRRDAWAATFDHVISSTFRHDAPLHLPDPPRPAAADVKYEAALQINDLQAEFMHNMALLHGTAARSPAVRTQAEYGRWMADAYKVHQRHVSHWHSHQNVSIQVLPFGADSGVLDRGWDVTPSRQEGMHKLTLSSRTLRSSDGWRFCLEAEQLVAGSRVTVRPCFKTVEPETNLRRSQQWSFLGDSTFRLAAAPGLCLAAHLYGPGEPSREVTVERCNDDVSQSWAYRGSCPGAPSADGSLQFGFDLNSLAITGSTVANVASTDYEAEFVI